MPVGWQNYVKDSDYVEIYEMSVVVEREEVVISIDEHANTLSNVVKFIRLCRNVVGDMMRREIISLTDRLKFALSTKLSMAYFANVQLFRILVEDKI